MAAPPDLVVVVGPTAAGKTALGVALAARLGGEIISADAFAVYRGLDVGTDKPSPAMRSTVRHHLLDVADPHESYSAGAFLRDADRAIDDIRRRGRRPVVVGGTLFYVRALLWGLFPEPPKDLELRRRLESAWARDPVAVRRQLAGLDPEAASRIAPADRQRTLRALEVCLASGEAMSTLWARHREAGPRYRHVMIALALSRHELHARIATRVERMFAAGVVDEVRRLRDAGVPPDAHALKAVGYRECLRVVEGEWSVDRAREATTVATRRLAKRQITWLRREDGTVWLAAAAPDLTQRAVRLLEASGAEGRRSSQE
jgi:tRNA dimethylallyltransferase